MRTESLFGVIAGIGFAVVGFFLFAVVHLVPSRYWWQPWATCSHCLEPTPYESLATHVGLAVILLIAGALAARIGPDRSPTRGAISTGLVGVITVTMMA